MQKRKLYLFIGLIAMLAMVAAGIAGVQFSANQAAQRTSVQASGDPDLLVPAVGQARNANWQAQPAKGSPAIVAWPNTKVNPDNGTVAQNEPFAAVNPSNSQHLVVGANQWNADGSFSVAAYVSFNGGKTWAASQPYINHNAGRLNAADATVAFGRDGAVYFAFVAFSPASGAVAVSRSVDGGLTWASQSWATSFTGSADKPAPAAGNGNLYLYYQGQGLQTTVSANNGSSWSTATTIDAAGRNAAPVVDAAGNVNVFYTTSSSLNVARMAVSASIASYQINTVSNIVALQPRPTQYRANIYPAAAVSPNGTLYVAWADGRNAGHGNDILLSSSTNGTSWSAPAVVNSDSGAADQLMPALTVGSDKAVTVAWLDNRDDPANVNYNVYMARSADGKTFGANTRVTSVASNPNNDPQLQGSMIGDYFAIAASNGAVYPFWTDTRNNNEDIYTAPISTGPQQ